MPGSPSAWCVTYRECRGRRKKRGFRVANDDKGEITEANKSILRGLTSEEEKRCPEQSDRNSIPTGTGDGKDVADHEIIGGEIRASRAMKTGQKKRLLGGIKKTKTLWENGTKLSRRRRNYRATGTSLCTDFCEVTTSDVHAVLRHAPADLQGGTLLQHTRVLVATVAHQENPHLCL